MPTGTLKKWNEARGYGFIQPDDATSSKDMFVHISAFRGAGIEPAVGFAYSYAVTEDRGKPIASHLKCIWPSDDDAA